MSGTKKPRVLIVGLGLAGSILSYKLLQKGAEVTIVDPDHLNTATKVAGGVWHPMVFKRINKAWMADECIPFVKEAYTEIQKTINKEIVHDLEVLKIFPNIQYAQDYSMKSKMPGFSHYLEIKKNELFDKHVDTEFGYGTVKIGGRIDLNSMVYGLREYYRTKNILFEEEMNDDDLTITPSGINWKKKSFDRVIFCRGSREPENSFFGNLPLKKTKGDVLVVKIIDKKYNTVVNNSKFIVPIGDSLYKIGSTYHHNDQTTTTSVSDRDFLLDKVKDFLGDNFEVTQHLAGIRPTVIDRRPLVGWHKEHRNIGILNGLGTRGVMIAPYCADVLISNLLEDKIIPHEIDISRFD